MTRRYGSSASLTGRASDTQRALTRQTMAELVRCRGVGVISSGITRRAVLAEVDRAVVRYREMWAHEIVADELASGSLTVRDLRDRTGMGKKAVRNALRRLQDARRADVHDDGKTDPKWALR